MENLPLVSVIIPTYNGEKYIKEALCSVLKQDYKNIEVLALDDGSHDKTPEKLKRLKQQYDAKDKIRIILNKQNRGIPRNMNLGLNESSGKYIAVLDQDDSWIDEQKLSKQVEFLEKNKDFGLIGTNLIIDRLGEKIRSNFPSSDENIRKIILCICCLQHSSVMYDRSLAMDIGGYSINHPYTQDYKLYLDIMKEAKVSNLVDMTTYYRLHGNNISIKKTKQQKKESLKLSREYKNDFPNPSKALFFRSGNLVLSSLIGGTPLFERIKLSIKNFYQS